MDKLFQAARLEFNVAQHAYSTVRRYNCTKQTYYTDMYVQVPYLCTIYKYKFKNYSLNIYKRIVSFVDYLVNNYTYYKQVYIWNKLIDSIENGSYDISNLVYDDFKVILSEIGCVDVSNIDYEQMIDTILSDNIIDYELASYSINEMTIVDFYGITYNIASDLMKALKCACCYNVKITDDIYYHNAFPTQFDFVHALIVLYCTNSNVVKIYKDFVQDIINAIYEDGIIIGNVLNYVACKLIGYITYIYDGYFYGYFKEICSMRNYGEDITYNSYLYGRLYIDILLIRTMQRSIGYEVMDDIQELADIANKVKQLYLVFSKEGSIDKSYVLYYKISDYIYNCVVNDDIYDTEYLTQLYEDNAEIKSMLLDIKDYLTLYIDKNKLMESIFKYNIIYSNSDDGIKVNIYNYLCSRTDTSSIKADDINKINIDSAFNICYYISGGLYSENRTGISWIIGDIINRGSTFSTDDFNINLLKKLSVKKVIYNIFVKEAKYLDDCNN